MSIPYPFEEAEARTKPKSFITDLLKRYGQVSKGKPRLTSVEYTRPGTRPETFYNQLNTILETQQEATLDAQERAQRRRQQILEEQARLAQQTPVTTDIKLPPVAQSTIRGQVSTGTGDFESFVSAIAGKESGGNYGAVNPHSGALGKYQIMPSNVRAWSRKFLGYTVSPNEFLRNPQLQEQIARAQLAEYYKKYGPAGAATAWYAGPGAVNTRAMRSTRTQTYGAGTYPSINSYWNDILRRMG